jgi:hypothetical protein
MSTKANGILLKRHHILFFLFPLGVFAGSFLVGSGTVYNWLKAKPETPAQLVASWKNCGMWLPDDSDVQFFRTRLPESLVDLRRGLDDSDATVRRCAAHAIQGLGADAISMVPDLERALRAEPDRLCRIYFAKAFGSLGDRSGRTVEFLQSTLANEKDDEVKNYLLYSIQMLTTGHAFPPLAEIVSHTTIKDKVRVFMGYAMLLSALLFAIIFYTRRKIMTEVFAPTSLLPRVILWVILVGMMCGAFWYLFVSHGEVLGEPPTVWFSELLFIYVLVYTIYRLCHPTGGSGHQSASNE